jgi:RNA polymerase sigma-70 factor (ECF subfamily)
MSEETPDPLSTRITLLVRLRLAPEDQAAWGEFVDRYGPQIYAWCQSFGLQAADAEDVTQTVLLKLASRLRDFEYDPQQRFRGWLRTITQNAWYDWTRSQRRGVAGSADSAVWAVLDSVAARDDLTTRLEAAFDGELLDLAGRRVRARVEARTWGAFQLTALEGRSGAEAAAALGMRVGTVFKAKSKVQRMLREEIERLEAEETPCPPARISNNSKTS